MIDLRNTREEAISVAELKSNQDANSAGDDTNGLLRSQSKLEHARKCGYNSEKSMDQDDEDDKETKYRLDPK